MTENPSKRLKRCASCGRLVTGGADICPYCKQPLVAAAPSETPAASNHPENESAPPAPLAKEAKVAAARPSPAKEAPGTPRPKAKRPAWVYVAGGLLAAALIAGGVYAFVEDDKKAGSHYDSEEPADYDEEDGDDADFTDNDADAGNDANPYGSNATAYESTPGGDSVLYSEPADAYESRLPGRYPFASERLLTDEELACYPSAELRLMRNEIYARHGYIFKSEDLAAHFGAQSWYTPRTSQVTLSDIEQKNVAKIRRYE